MCQKEISSLFINLQACSYKNNTTIVVLSCAIYGCEEGNKNICFENHNIDIASNNFQMVH